LVAQSAVTGAALPFSTGQKRPAGWRAGTPNQAAVCHAQNPGQRQGFFVYPYCVYPFLRISWRRRPRSGTS